MEITFKIGAYHYRGFFYDVLIQVTPSVACLYAEHAEYDVILRITILNLQMQLHVTVMFLGLPHGHALSN